MLDGLGAMSEKWELMMRVLALSCAIVGMSSAVLAEEAVLLCSYEKNYDFQRGEVEIATGSFPFTLGYEDGQIVDFTTPFPCGVGTVESKLWNDELHISCVQLAGEDVLHRYFQIDPRSGAFAMMSVDLAGKESVQFGSCTATESL